jgi:hypothetical protein
MSSVAGELKVTLAEYAAAEDASDSEHPLVDGEVFDMGGGTPEHAALVASIGRELGSPLRDCQLDVDAVHEGVFEQAT